MSIFENHDPDSLIDTLIDGRFRLRTETARSGSSTVFVARDLRTDVDVSVRVFSASRSACMASLEAISVVRRSTSAAVRPIRSIDSPVPARST